MRWSWLLVAVACLGGCGTLRSGNGWGERATPLPGFARLGSALTAAATDPYTWAPAAAATVFGVTGWDGRVSHWASKQTPVFGSQSNAYRTSDTLNDVGGALALLTALATPSGNTAGEVLLAKAKGIAVELVSVGATQTATANLKSLTHRTRPDRSDDQSFPSGHSSKAFAYASVSRHNIDTIPMPGGLRTGLDMGFTALGAATAWARIEAKKHYPSDVLAGAALANFTTTFFIDAFLGLEPSDLLSFRIDPEPGGFLAHVSLRY